MNGKARAKLHRAYKSSYMSQNLSQRLRIRIWLLLDKIVNAIWQNAKLLDGSAVRDIRKRKAARSIHFGVYIYCARHNT